MAPAIVSILNEFPYPFDRREAQELHMVFCQIYPTSKGAIFVAEKAGLQASDFIYESSAYEVWAAILKAAANAQRSRALVETVCAQHPNNPRTPFLKALLNQQPAAVMLDTPGANGAPSFIVGNDEVGEPEALLYHGDLTLSIGRVPWLIETLKTLLKWAPAVCRLEVARQDLVQQGTGFRIGPDLILSNWHVLRVQGQPADAITAEFRYEADAQGAPIAATVIKCDPGAVRGDAADDWAVVRVATAIPNDIPIVDLEGHSVPVEDAPAFVIQHPAGGRKRIGFIRNQITEFDERIVHYLTDTQVGSSGSPVLDDRGRVVALHHAGGRPQEVAGKPPVAKNEGIRISCVLAGLKALPK